MIETQHGHKKGIPKLRCDPNPNSNPNLYKGVYRLQRIMLTFRSSTLSFILSDWKSNLVDGQKQKLALRRFERIVFGFKKASASVMLQSWSINRKEDLSNGESQKLGIRGFKKFMKVERNRGINRILKHWSTNMYDNASQYDALRRLKRMMKVWLLESGGRCIGMFRLNCQESQAADKSMKAGEHILINLRKKFLKGHATACVITWDRRYREDKLAAQNQSRGEAICRKIGGQFRHKEVFLAYNGMLENHNAHRNFEKSLGSFEKIGRMLRSKSAGAQIWDWRCKVRQEKCNAKGEAKLKRVGAQLKLREAKAWLLALRKAIADGRLIARGEKVLRRVQAHLEP